jgi:hypothetical protein
VVKLAGLIDGLAAAFQVAPSRVRTAAAQLRKHKLLTTGPRGPGAPDMTPKDAANLLLAVLYDAELSEAHQTVARLRQATVVRSVCRRWGEPEAKLDTLPRNGFVTSPAGESFTLAGLIEAMLDRWVRYGTLYEGDEDDIDLDPVNVTLEIMSPDYRGRLTFNTPCSLFWTLEYEWKSPEQIEYEAKNSGMLATRWDARNGPHIWSSRSVGEDCLYHLADCLRGCEWQDEWEEFRPLHEKASAPAREVETV